RGSPSRAGIGWPSTSRWTMRRGSPSFVRLAIRGRVYSTPVAPAHPPCACARRAGSSREQPVDLRGENEIVLEEATDGEGPERDLHLAVVHAEVWMVSFLFGEGRHSIHEGDRLGKGFEDEGLHQATGFDLPAGNLGEKRPLLLFRHGRGAALAGHTPLGSQVHAESLGPKHPSRQSAAVEGELRASLDRARIRARRMDRDARLCRSRTGQRRGDSVVTFDAPFSWFARLALRRRGGRRAPPSCAAGARESPSSAGARREALWPSVPGAPPRRRGRRRRG